MIRSRFEIDIVELNGRETDNRNGKRPQLAVYTHPTSEFFTCFEIGETKFTLNVTELGAVINALGAANLARYLGQK